MCKPLEDFGDTDHHRRALAELTSGRSVGAFATTEAGAGSDVGAITTTATPDGDGHRLSGTKMFITNAPVADLFLVTARTTAGRGAAGITAFLVPRSPPGLSVGPAEPLMGLNGAPIGEVHLDDCRVEASARLGPRDGGGAIVQHAMRWERALILAPQLGVMQRQLDAAVDHARTRVQFGKRIGSFQGVSHRIAQMAIRLDAARLLLYRGAWALGQL